VNTQERRTFLKTLAERFAANPNRRRGVSWDAVEARLEKNATALKTLDAMERSGGEPDVVGVDEASGGFVICDCSKESPVGRRSLCYDRAALDARKENRPEGSVVETAAKMGVELLDEEAYRALQRLGEFDLKTSSWIATPKDVRSLGGALFCDRRYGRVFTYHNGAQSYYASRGFRGRTVV
jgi:hypothetical protein